MSFTDQFTNVLISPVNKRYRLITLIASTSLVWPIESATSDNTLLEWMDVTENAGGYVIELPDATGGGEGFSSIIVNTGSHSFTISDFGGNVIQVIAAGEAWLIWLKDNSTANGSWQALQIGSTTSEASAATLAGAGLKVIGFTLNQSHPVWDVTGDYTVITNDDRARLLLWTGGSGTINFPSAATMGDDWFTLIANQGSASITLDPSGAELIDGASTKTLAIGESCFVISSGTALYTVGYGRSIAYTETYASINVGGSADVTLTSSQFASNIFNLFGVLTGNIAVIVPAAVHSFIVFNNTSGAFTLTVMVSGQTGVAVDQGKTSLLYCNGTDVFSGNDSSATSTVLFNNGTVTAPSITFVSDTDTGFFRNAANQIGVAAGGILSALFNTAASGVNALTITPAATGVAAVLGSYSGTDTNVGIAITPQGTGGITLSNAVTASSTLGVVGVASFADGTVSAPSVTFTSDPDTGFYRISANYWSLAGGGEDIIRLKSNATSPDYWEFNNGSGSIALFALGASTNIGLSFTAKGSGAFLVTATSSTFSGTLGVTSDFAVATNKFTVAASSGDTVVGGTLAVSGILTASSTLGVTGSITGASFIPSSSSVPSNGLYLPAANTLGLSVNSTGEIQLTSSALSPITSDGNALGTASLMWSDLFLAAGGVINWNNGNATLTHSSGFITSNVPIAAVNTTKAWVNFNGTLSGTITPRSSYNIASVVKNGTGDYTIAFANAMTDANYAISCSAGRGNLAANPRISGPGNSDPTANFVRITVTTDAGVLNDVEFVSVIINGN